MRNVGETDVIDKISSTESSAQKSDTSDDKKSIFQPDLFIYLKIPSSDHVLLPFFFQCKTCWNKEFTHELLDKTISFIR